MAAEIIILPRDRLAWHKQIALSSVSPMALRIAVLISTHINNKTGRTFLGLDQLAALARVSRRTVWAGVEELQDDGHLEVNKGGGRARANTYRMIIKTVQPIAPFSGPETVQNPAQNGAAHCTPTLKNNSSSKNYNSMPAPGSREDRQQRTTIARRKLREFAYSSDRSASAPQEADRDQTRRHVLKACTPHWYELHAWYETNGDQRSADLMRARAESGSGYWTAPPGWQPISQTIIALRGRR